MKPLRIPFLTALPLTTSLLLGAAVLLPGPGASFAQETAVRGQPVPAPAEAPASRLIPAQDSAAGPLLRMVGLTLGIVAVGGAITGWARQRARKRTGTAGAIEILDVRSIGPRHRVAVIEIGARRVLVGMGNDTITTLLDLSEGAEFTQALGRELPDAQEPAPLVGRFEGLDG